MLYLLGPYRQEDNEGKTGMTSPLHAHGGEKVRERPGCGHELTAGV